MQARIRLFALALAATVAVPAQAGPATTGAAATPANAIVGLWTTTEGIAGPCGGQGGMPIFNTLLFHAGGTVVEIPRFPPGGVAGFERTQALGVWWYDPATKSHAIHLRFDRFQDGVWLGHSTVDRELQLSADGETATGAVQVVNYNAGGTQVGPTICGQPVSRRVM